MSLTPRKRPAQQRSKAMVDAIVEAAARILESAGLDALTTNAVAMRAGVSIGSLYQYYPGRESILAELLRREREHLLHAITHLSSNPGASLEDDLHSLVRIAVAHQLHRPRLASVLEYAEMILPMHSETTELARSVEALVAGLLKRHGRTEVEAGDVVAMAKGMIDAAGLAGETDQDALSNRVARALFGYLGLTI